MGKLSQLLKNENIIDISFDEIFSYDFTKYILTSYPLNSLKGVAIGFNHDPQTTSEFV